MQIQLKNPLRSGPINLVPADASHASERYAGWLNMREVVRHTEVQPGASDVASVGRYIAASLAARDSLLFAIECDGHGHIGTLRLGNINPKHRRATVALLIGEVSLWGRGYAAHAIGLAGVYAFGDLGLHKLSAGVYAIHPASRGAFEKAGYRCEATLREHAFVDERFIDVWQMVKFAND